MRIVSRCESIWQLSILQKYDMGIKIREAAQFKDQLDRLFASYKDLPDDDLIKSHYSRYLCLMVSNFIQVWMKGFCIRIARERSDRVVLNFVESAIERLPNPNAERFRELIAKFSPEWKERVEKKFASEQVEAFNSIYNNRNQIAHGGSNGVTFTTIKAWYENVLKALCDAEDIAKFEIDG